MSNEQAERELKPCPFCGSEPWGVFGPTPDFRPSECWVECHGTEDSVCGNWYWEGTRAETREAWNRRASLPPPGREASTLTANVVVAAINAVGDEAARRGEMYPQTSDEQRDDRRVVRRVCEMLLWYDKNTGCARIKGWPLTSSPPKTQEQA